MSDYLIPDTIPPEYIIGVDLGQAQDYTAVAVLQRDTRETGKTRTKLTDSWGGGFGTRQVPETENAYQVRHLERLPLGTPYPEQVEKVSQIVTLVRQQQAASVGPWQSAPKPRPPRLIVDQTGVGRPVVDMLRKAGHRSLTAVTITAGDTATREGMEHRVPKRELVSVLQVLLQTERLAVAAALPEAETLTKEMLAFKVTISKTGHDSYGNDWRENPHDDLVLAVALAAWAGERVPTVGMRRNYRD